MHKPMNVIVQRFAKATLLGFISLLVGQANASLIQSDFLSIGDGFLVTDSSTSLQWLTPFYTKSHTFNDVFVQSITSTYGFRYATANETQSLIVDNFNNPTTVALGDVAGYASAQSFLTIFGINENVTCGTFACPRTQGLTADSTSAGTHLAFGMIQYGSNGWMIANNSWSDSIFDTQMGSFLVRVVTPVPEPEIYAMMGIGLGLLGWVEKRRKQQAAA